MQIYRVAGEWLAANTPAESSVGALEVGIVGYYARRPMVDFAGLIQPAVSEQLTKTATYQDSAQWAILTYHPDYLLLGPTWFPALMSGTVLPHCQERQKFPGAPYGYPGELVVYQCMWAEGSKGVGDAVLQSSGVKTNIKL